jgi:diacylglycerol kinase (ATP)
MQILIVANEKSGSSGEQTLKDVASKFETLGEATVIQPPSVDAFDEDVQRAAQGKDLVVAAGGDGTLHATMNALWESREGLEFAVVPMGTGNDFAHTLELPEDPVEASAALAKGRTKRIDVGRATREGAERLFINACMGGFPVAADEAIGGDVKKRLGPFAFWVGGAKAAVQMQRYDVVVDDQPYENVAAVGIGNGRTAGGGIPIFADADPSDQKLDCCVFEIDAVSDALKLLPKMKAGTHAELQNVQTLKGERIQVKASPQLEFNVDGELIDFTSPATFEVAGSIEFRIPGLTHKPRPPYF